MKISRAGQLPGLPHPGCGPDTMRLEFK